MSKRASAEPPYVIGDPGRAAREVEAGPPVPYAGHSDVELSSANLPGMLVQAATVRGLMHRARAEPRQDAFALGRFDAPDGVPHMLAVVCDGLGSFGRSHEAAAMVSRRLVELGRAGADWADCFARVNRELHEHTTLVGARPRTDPASDAMATTAIALAVHRSGGEWHSEVAWVGDSPLFWLTPDGDWVCLTEDEEDGGEFHTTKVRPLPSPDGAVRSRSVRLGSGALFLMTDGISNPLKWGPDVQKTLADWWAEPPDLFTFGAQAAFGRRTHVDDRTVVAFWLDPDGDLGPADTGDSPVATEQEPGLGAPEFVAAGGSTGGYRVPERAPAGGPASPARKKFLHDLPEHARAAEAAVRFREGLPEPAAEEPYDHLSSEPRILPVEQPPPAPRAGGDARV